MTPGKMCSQSGHAYCEALLASHPNSTRFADYRKDGLGTKVCLAADNLQQLLDAQAKCEAAGIPCALITDSGCANFFNGAPTVTALGVGPAKKHEVKKITGRFSLVR